MEGKMVCWIIFLFIIRVHCHQTKNYLVHQEEASFEDAQQRCKDFGFLTDMNNRMEVDTGILPVVANTLQSKGDFHFWIGLIKFKTDCIDKEKPLRGFVWTVNNSSHSSVNIWRKNPIETCVNMLCGSLSVEYNGSSITDWGFMEKKCKTKQKFICKKDAAKISRSSDKTVTTDQPNIMKGTPYPRGTGLLINAYTPSNPSAKLTRKHSLPSTSTLRIPTTPMDPSNFQHNKLNIFLPVLIALSVLVVLVVVILVIVKCCLMKKFKGKKGPQSKESMSLNATDPEEQSNEKESLRD